MRSMEDDEWKCDNCGSTDPHNATHFPKRERLRELGFTDEKIDEMIPELEVDVTCQSVYITPVDGGSGVAFTHDEFEEIIDHYEEAV